MMTYTQRDLFPPIGLQAVLSYDEGTTWDFDIKRSSLHDGCFSRFHDKIIIEGKTGWGLEEGGGYGNTLPLNDGSGQLISCYSFRTLVNGSTEQTQCYTEIVRWMLPDSVG